MNMLIMLLPGTAITYQGEEIGMEDMKIRWDQTLDIVALSVGPSLYESYTRDPVRTPFQWNGSHHAGTALLMCIASNLLDGGVATGSVIYF
jgi:alpha-glucosidase